MRHRVHLQDKVHNGYVEALNRTWQPMSDMRLSEKDENGSRTMNTHLHIIEAYTSLLRIWKSEELKERVRNLLYILRQFGITNNAHAHIDLFPNALFNLFTLSAERYPPGIKVKR